jgi:hypothetical protein
MSTQVGPLVTLAWFVTTSARKPSGFSASQTVVGTWPHNSGLNDKKCARDSRSPAGHPTETALE